MANIAYSMFIGTTSNGWIGPVMSAFDLDAGVSRTYRIHIEAALMAEGAVPDYYELTGAYVPTKGVLVFLQFGTMYRFYWVSIGTNYQDGAGATATFAGECEMNGGTFVFPDGEIICKVFTSGAVSQIHRLKPSGNDVINGTWSAPAISGSGDPGLFRSADGLTYKAWTSTNIGPNNYEATTTSFGFSPATAPSLDSGSLVKDFPAVGPSATAFGIMFSGMTPCIGRWQGAITSISGSTVTFIGRLNSTDTLGVKQGTYSRSGDAITASTDYHPVGSQYDTDLYDPLDVMAFGEFLESGHVGSSYVGSLPSYSTPSLSAAPWGYLYFYEHAGVPSGGANVAECDVAGHVLRAGWVFFNTSVNANQRVLIGDDIYSLVETDDGLGNIGADVVRYQVQWFPTPSSVPDYSTTHMPEVVRSLNFGPDYFDYAFGYSRFGLHAFVAYGSGSDISTNINTFAGDDFEATIASWDNTFNRINYATETGSVYRGDASGSGSVGVTTPGVVLGGGAVAVTSATVTTDRVYLLENSAVLNAVAGFKHNADINSGGYTGSNATAMYRAADTIYLHYLQNVWQVTGTPGSQLFEISQFVQFERSALHAPGDPLNTYVVWPLLVPEPEVPGFWTQRTGCYESP